jgi:hypothetical protein
MSTARSTNLPENERYGDEVMNANGLPQMILAALGMSPQHRKPQVRNSRSFGSEREAEDFMQRLYRAQE